ncbi:MAG: Hpt domain-containing protein [Burkholderiales bacterium]|nr:Hpt domain-containing protein [Burkholderiales bacterium]
MHEDENADMSAAGSIDPLSLCRHGGAATLDRRALDRLRELDPHGRQGLLQRVLRTYVASLTAQLETIEAANGRGDVRQLRFTVHALKSSSAAVGALALSEGCAEIEHFLRDRERMPAAATIDALVTQGHAVLAAVGDILAA